MEFGTLHSAAEMKQRVGREIKQEDFRANDRRIYKGREGRVVPRTQETVNQNRNMVQKRIHHCLLFERTQMDQRSIYSCDIFIKHFNRCTLNKCKLIK